MREALGGTLLTYIVLFFLAVYIAFMAIVINYAKVYKLKNEILSYIENSEGLTDYSDTTALENLKNSSGYSDEIKICYYHVDRNNSVYYSIRLYMAFSLPLVNNKIQIPINGKTSAIRIPKNIDIDTKSVVKECDVDGSFVD